MPLPTRRRRGTWSPSARSWRATRIPSTAASAKATSPRAPWWWRRKATASSSCTTASWTAGCNPGATGTRGRPRARRWPCARRVEETGLEDLRLHPKAPRPLDVDVHDIPARGEEPAHEHLDLRYLVMAPPAAFVSRSLDETNDLRWFSWDELDELDLDPDCGDCSARHGSG